MLSKSWVREFWRVVFLLIGALFFGALLGLPITAIVLAILGYLGWNLLQLYRLERWLRLGSKYQPPEAEGVWGDVFSLFYRAQQRDRKRKKSLVKMLTRFQESTAAMPDATIVLNEYNDIQWFNNAARELLGLRPNTDNGRRIDNLLRHPDFIHLLNAKDAEPSVDIQSPLHKDITLNLRIIPYGKNQRLLIARDISQRLRLEKIRRDFVANVSHELRTPLTVVSGYLETMLDAQDPQLKEWERPLEQMSRQTFRMQQIVEDLLLLSNLENSRHAAAEEPVDVPAMLAVIREGAEQLAQHKRHDIHLKCERLLRLKGSEKELYSAFNNLVSNAVRYTPEGGDITIRWYHDDKAVYFEVTDTGIGIAPQHIPRLTERFYRVDTARSRENGGTGLGLAIVKHVLMHHDATIQIESEIGRGSTFRCIFPRERFIVEAESEIVEAME